LSFYWAKFERRNNHLFRFDTRIYLKSIVEPSIGDLCIGAVVGKNPGSAIPNDYNLLSMQEINLNDDKLLPNIRSIFIKAYNNAKEPIPKNSYVQMLNLIYVCDNDLGQAIKKIEEHPHPIICDKEEQVYPFLWYVWGGGNMNLNPYKSRFRTIKSASHFYVNTYTYEVINVPPGLHDPARHPQGLRHDSIVPFISSIL
jgi:hypothetical protein